MLILKLKSLKMNKFYLFTYLFTIFISGCKYDNRTEDDINTNSIDKNDILYAVEAILQEQSIDSKDIIKSESIDTVNVKELGEECSIDDECINKNCQKHFKGYYCSLKEGNIFPNIELKNQFNEIVSLNNFKGKNKYILLEMGTVWCSPCNDLAGWLAFGENNIKSKIFWKPEYDKIYSLIKDNKVELITVLYEDEFRNTATIKTAEEWYSTFPDQDITILADEDREMQNLIKATGIPAISLLNTDLEVVVLSTRGFNQAFDKLIEIFK